MRSMTSSLLPPTESPNGLQKLVTNPCFWNLQRHIHWKYPVVHASVPGHPHHIKRAKPNNSSS